MTPQGWIVVGIVACLAIGLLAGLLGYRIGRRAARRTSATTAPTLGQLLGGLVHTSSNGLVVLHRDGGVVMHNPRAAELGIVTDNAADQRALRAAEHVRGTGEILEIDLSPTGNGRGPNRGPDAIHGHVRPLREGFVALDVADSSETVRLENTRRDFVANISHELKTPVGALALLAEAVMDTADDPEEVRRFGSKLLHESTRLGSLVSELIALSRLQGAARLPELVVVDVDDVLTEALARSRVAAEHAGIEIAIGEPTGLRVDGDRTLLVTALGNLLDNAIAYSPPQSSVTVTRSVSSEIGPGGETGTMVEISVTDRGIGIATEQQQRVFERFYRVDAARSRETGGTGLGLAIVKHVAANHGGEVRLWSRPKVGSTFTLRIPRHRADDEDCADPGAVPQAGLAHGGPEPALPTGAPVQSRAEGAA